ncbi:STAS/SEC14 domain-containing protein [Vannielia litorea]|uniref:STAS/SEC14 domain-containing protein n=1 Tax=Vannielia litorea TaxID=1217970 RepID=UPI001BCF759E|nr:STAS/SEC14 domain-containing protein [Vannielia litorea]MBS8227022.1 STAS/SEC14 domain-containing protein [Vannielia litorea]
MPDGFTILPDTPPNVLAVAGHGIIDAAAYEEVLRPALEARLERHDTIRLLYILEEDFEGFTAGAAISDARLGFSHLHDFARIALVTDADWVTHAVRLFAPLIQAPLRCFPLARRREAEAWIAEADDTAEAQADPPGGDDFPV